MTVSLIRQWLYEQSIHFLCFIQYLSTHSFDVLFWWHSICWNNSVLLIRLNVLRGRFKVIFDILLHNVVDLFIYRLLQQLTQRVERLRGRLETTPPIAGHINSLEGCGNLYHTGDSCESFQQLL